MSIILSILLAGWFPVPEFTQEVTAVENAAVVEIDVKDQLLIQQKEEITRLNDAIKSLHEKLEQQEIQNIYFKIMFLRPSLRPDIAKNIASHVYSYSNKNNIDSDLILSMIRVESYFEQRAVSPTGARGLMQIMMSFWKDECEVNSKTIYDIEKNINCGILVLNTYYQRYNNIYLALVAYNVGDSSVDFFLKHKKKIDYSYARMTKKFYKQLKSVQAPFPSERERKDLLGF